MESHGRSEINSQGRKKWKDASLTAANNDKWAETMTKQLIRCNSEKYWQIVSFRGPKGGESRGIVDAIAIRKDHKPRNYVNNKTLKPGDLFEIVLIQVKGGSSPDPKIDDRERMREVGKHYYNAKCVLARWIKHELRSFYLLDESSLKWIKKKPEDLFK